MCANNFFRCDGILGRRPGGQVLRDHVSRRISSEMGMTLRSLKTYGYIDSKTKNYQIQRGFFLLFIFLQTLTFKLHAFWPYPSGHMPFVSSAERIRLPKPSRILNPFYNLNLHSLSSTLTPKKANFFCSEWVDQTPRSRTHCVQQAVSPSTHMVVPKT